jgi:hypothetical protein
MSGKSEPADAKDETESSSLSKSTQNVVLPEIAEALRQEGSHVDVNVLLVQLISKTKDPDAIVLNSEKMLAVAQSYEEARVENFRRMADAIIDVKNRDPDELEKRRNNRMRRCLKGIVGGCSLVGLGGGIAGILAGGNIVVVGALLTAGCIALAMSGPLATGESMSSNDVVRIVSAMRMMLPERRGDEDDEKESGSKNTPGPDRRRQRR